MKVVRWVQRFDKYCKTLKLLEQDLDDYNKTAFSEREKRGTIKIFELTLENAWKTLKDFFESEQVAEHKLIGSKDIIELALKEGLVFDNTLLRAIESRNKTVHAYDENVANEIFNLIKDDYFKAFKSLKDVLIKEKERRSL